jgi:hypothetical protein
MALIRTKTEAKVLVGRTIKSVELNPFEEEDGTISYRPTFLLDDGSCVAFDAHSTESGDSVTVRHVTREDRAKARATLKSWADKHLPEPK